MVATALEVWGDPVSHSLSPTLHRAAYAHLGWSWTYDLRRVGEAEFSDALASLGSEYRGLSCTMPLKGVAFRAGAEHDTRSALTRASNTLLLTGSAPRAYNTDVGGIVRALADSGIHALDSARILGAGATAASALVALSEIGARDVEVVARRPEAVTALSEIGARLGVAVRPAALTVPTYDPRPVTVSTLPGGIDLAADTVERLAMAGGLLFDVVYGRGPTPLGSAWRAAGHPAQNGEGMLLHQAVLQVRLFASGDIDEPLPDEPAVVAVMRRALVGG